MKSPDFQSKLSEVSVTLQKDFFTGLKTLELSSVAKTKLDGEKSVLFKGMEIQVYL